MGRKLGAGRRPAAGQRALRREVLDARHDGDRPQHRPQRRVRARPGQAGRRQRALRLGLLPPAHPDVRQDRARHRRRAVRARARRGQGRPRADDDLDLDAADLQRPGRDVQGHRPRADRQGLPQPTRASRCDLAIKAVFDSWNAPRAVLYRRQERIPADLGTAVNIVRHGLRQLRHGLRHRRRLHPRPGHRPAGRLRRLPAERPGRGRRRRHPQHHAAAGAGAHRQGAPTTSSCGSWRRWRTTTGTCATSSSPSSAASSGCCRPGSASAPPAAAFRIATQLVDQGLITMDEAVTRVTGDQLAQLMFPRFDAAPATAPIAKGMNASPGAAVGKAVFSSERADRAGRRGRGRHPGAPRDQPRRPRRHDRRRAAS